ncbi:MAG: hypothetical protein VX589_15645 [Myxococcota bacterium]|nr:hypothetical protein [Myxococcota bacterium]
MSRYTVRRSTDAHAAQGMSQTTAQSEAEGQPVCAVVCHAAG